MEKRMLTPHSGRHFYLLFSSSHFLKKVFLFVLVVCGLAAQAQNKIHVSGIVKDDKGTPAANASVTVKGSKNGVSTDANGLFGIDVPSEKSVLVISYLGFAPQELVVGKQTSLNVNLALATGTLSDVVVVGYGTQKKVTVTGAVAMVKGSELVKSPAVNLSNSIAGRLPGVVAMNGSGEPGYDGSTIRIRGTNSLGNNDALIVIDGVPNRTGGLDRLNPADIESMSVLKDASAAIYGARAANGVILITTKRGKSGKPEFSYSYNKGWAAPTILPKMLDAVEYATMANEIELYKLTPDLWAAAAAAYKTPTGKFSYPAGSYGGTAYTAGTSTAPFLQADIQKYKDGSDPWGHPNTDWFGTVLKPWSNQSRQNMQISGGSENVRYLTSLGYENQDGQYKHSATGYKQYDLRINLDAKINKYISTQFGVTARQENRYFPTKTAGAIFRMLMRGYPYKNAIWPNGLPAPDIENGEQPVVITTNQTGYDRDTRYYVQTNGKLEITNPWIKGLKFTLNASYDKYIKQEKYWVTPWYVYNWSGFDANNQPIMTKVQKGPTTQPTLTQTSYDQNNSMLEGILSYDHTIGNHAITVLAGVTKEKFNGSGFNAFRQYFASPVIDQLYAGGLTDQRANNDNYLPYQGARLNYFGRVGYNYKEKYIAEFLWREDASSNFPAAHRWGFFPGVTAGWRISEEEFFKRNVNFVNTLKLRGSWGQLGNDRLEKPVNVLHPYDYIALYNYGTYVAGGQVQSTLTENNVANPNITWEVANNFDAGLEGTMFNNRLSFEFDLFWNHRTNILWDMGGSIPGSTGLPGPAPGNSTPISLLPATNIAKVDNKGYEFKVGYATSIGQVKFNIGINGGYAKNKIKYWNETPGRPSYQLSTGKVLPTDVSNPDDMLLYQYDGVFATQKDVDANKLDYTGVGGAGKLFPGSMKFKDVNGDGKIDANDRVRSDKSRIPTFQGGITLGASYKDFDLSILFQAATGAEIFFQPETGTIGNYVQTQYDHRWTLDNPSSVDPRTVDRNNQYFSNRNTYYMLNTNYIRLKNFELGYTLPASIGKKAGISRMRFYVNGLNMITFSHTKGIFDPESTSSSGQYYPQSKIINTGVTVTF